MSWYYAVAVGYEIGVYEDWYECESQVSGYPNCDFRKFSDYYDAQSYVYYYKRHDDGYVQVYTDGACPGNGNPRARAAIGIWWGDDHEENVGQRLCPKRYKQTNNEAEIMAVVKAIGIAKEKRFRKLTVNTDSQFLINCCCSWVNTWRQNGWKTSKGLEVKNRTSLEKFLSAQNGINVNFRHVVAHSGVEGNEGADKLARDAAHTRCRCCGLY